MASLFEQYPDLLDKVQFDASGLVPAILQDAATGRVLMLAYMNRESLQKSLETGHCWFWSRSRQALWEKGITSGNRQLIDEIEYDCDGDALLIQVRPEGPACHTGSFSCFDAPAPKDAPVYPAALFRMLRDLQVLLHQRNLERPEGSYTTRLFEAGILKIAKKLGEEGVEVALAAVQEKDDRLAEEVADLLYNLLVLLEYRGVSLNAVGEELQKRAAKRMSCGKKSG